MDNSRTKRIMLLALQQQNVLPKRDFQQIKESCVDENIISNEVTSFQPITEVNMAGEDMTVLNIDDVELLQLIDPMLPENEHPTSIDRVVEMPLFVEESKSIEVDIIQELAVANVCESNNVITDTIDSTQIEKIQKLAVVNENEIQVENNENTQEFVQIPKKLTIEKKRKIAKNERVRGRNYLGYKRIEGKVQYNIPREKRELKDRCNHISKDKMTVRSFRCSDISDEQRKKLFNEFWDNFKTWKEKEAYVKGLVSSRLIKRRRKNVAMKRLKLEGHDIHLHHGNGEKVRVCRRFFLNTLCLGADTYKRWVKNEDILYDSFEHNEEDDPTTNSKSMTNKTTTDESGQSTDSEESNNPQKIKEEINSKRKSLLRERRKKMEARKQKIKQINKDQSKGSEKYKKIEEWIGLLPKVPSHYCRASSKRIYVESSFRSNLHMYNVYREWCTEHNLKPAGRKLFDSVIKNKNIAIHAPRKDQCDTCSSFKVGNISERDYKNHIKKKNAARDAKAAAKESANSEKLVITMDLQSVFLCPKTLDSALYYKQKLQLHNFTIFELNNKDVHLYVWHEANGGVSANEFTSCIVDYLSNCSENYKEVVLISDGCNYQNRNRTLASALSDLAKKKSITIQQLYLEKGHTMMEADNVHSVLEHLFKPPLFSPPDYISRMRMARPSKPYNIKVVDHSFFLNYEALPTNLPSVRPGKKVGDPKVIDIRQLQYKACGEIQYQLGFDGDWQQVPHRRKPGDYLPERLYSTQLPIIESKYRHLQELKSLIEKDHHPFYDNLTYKADKK